MVFSDLFSHKTALSRRLRAIFLYRLLKIIGKKRDGPRNIQYYIRNITNTLILAIPGAYRRDIFHEKFFSFLINRSRMRINI